MDYDPCHLMCAFWLAVLTAHVISGGHAFSAIQIEAVVSIFVHMYVHYPYPFKRASYLRDKVAGCG